MARTSGPELPPEYSFSHSGMSSLTYRFSTVTPHVGGAADAARTSPRAREAQVANLLRRWWRACHAESFGTVDELFAAEEALWGSANVGGRVSVRTRTTTDAKIVELPKNPNPPYGFGRLPAYATFPWSSEGSITVARGLEFDVSIRCPVDRVEEIREAVRAFVLFGGIGRRARRGFGSLQAVECGAEVSPLDWPSAHPRHTNSYTEGLPRSVRLRNAPDAISAWQQAVGAYQKFRQGAGVGRDDSGGNHPGRSRYPEPDTLRRRSHTHSAGHAPRISVDAFPRADLGLPIVTEFKPADHGEPPKTLVEGAHEGHRRFESPVITKAVSLNGIWYAMVAVLDVPHVWEGGNQVSLVEGGRRSPIPLSELALAVADLVQIDADLGGTSPLGQSSIRDALLASLPNGWVVRNL